VSSYFVAKNLSELPLQLMSPVIISAIAYFLIGLRLCAAPLCSTSYSPASRGAHAGLQPVASKFFIFLAALVCSVFNAQSLGLLIGASTPSLEVAQIVSPLVIIIMMLFGGRARAQADPARAR
jgi:hypothetical protein